MLIGGNCNGLATEGLDAEAGGVVEELREGGKRAGFQVREGLGELCEGFSPTAGE